MCDKLSTCRQISQTGKLFAFCPEHDLSNSLRRRRKGMCFYKEFVEGEVYCVVVEIIPHISCMHMQIHTHLTRPNPSLVHLQIPMTLLLTSSVKVSNTVEPLYSGHHWDYRNCPVYRLEVSLFQRLLYTHLSELGPKAVSTI